MRSKSIVYFVIFILVFCVSCKSQELSLTTNGIANYTIVTGNDGKEQTAAKELQSALKKISGADFSITESASANSINVLSETDAAKKLPSLKIPGEEGVSIQVVDKNIYIIGGTGNGIRNAVYEFLEKYLGCRYYAADAVLMPKNKNISIASNINYAYTPVIRYRFIHFGPAFQGEYPAWNKLQNTPNGKVSLPAFGLWVHSMFTLVPPGKYFDSHPEYYALRNGKRVKTQLDLTNLDVLRIAKQSLDSIIQKNSQATIFSVSQMDNNGYCECDNCKRKAIETGSQSGVILSFVNQLATAFPNKTISTLAYNYSRSAPTNIAPAKNVNIMFCATGANRSIAFKDDKSKGSAYYDLNAWSKLTHNIFFWDYLVDFRHLYLPFPIYHTLQSNIQLLAANKVASTFQQGWAYNGSDMPELKAYLISQLLWNPDSDVKAIQDEFIQYYYGDAASYISKYISDITSYIQSHKINLTVTDAPLDHVDDYLSPTQVKLYQQDFDNAKKAVAGKPIYLNRVQNAEQSLRYAILDGASKQNANEKDSSAYISMLKEFRNVAANANVKSITEGNGNSLNDFIEEQNAYQKNKVISNNNATGASVVITTPASYTVKNINTLCDKVRGSNTIDGKWVAFQQPQIELVVDLKKKTSFDSVSATFMHNPLFKIQLPESVKYAVSNNGTNFTNIGIAKNIWAGLGVKEELKTFTIKSSANTSARYIKLSFKMVNSPNITGDDLPQSMLCDEIIVR